jgi:hypothetical protein
MSVCVFRKRVELDAAAPLNADALRQTPQVAFSQPSLPVTFSEVVARTRVYYAEFDVDEDVDPDEVEKALLQLHAAGEVTRADSAGRWSLVPYDRSIFRLEIHVGD